MCLRASLVLLQWWLCEWITSCDFLLANLNRLAFLWKWHESQPLRIRYSPVCFWVLSTAWSNSNQSIVCKVTLLLSLSLENLKMIIKNIYYYRSKFMVMMQSLIYHFNEIEYSIHVRDRLSDISTTSIKKKWSTLIPYWMKTIT